jgi:TRAP-type C4-dicarboxylate transport system substrate-binding protein
MDKIPASLRPAFLKAVADSTVQQRVIANDKAGAAIEELKKKGMTFFPMSTADRAAVRQEMQARLWADFAKQYPATAPLFDSIAKARG